MTHYTCYKNATCFIHHADKHKGSISLKIQDSSKADLFDLQGCLLVEAIYVK